ncbi:hypothetical protein GO594_07400 [Pseudomonas otitidis]|uniref:Uncharacterized protein n=1 Tax=Metapseudomonas otitidis TaxID=319939 RepID=A0A7X3H654_9GAMM|nr:hypothetical protein [Pseudomonas otitidis]MWK55795.1 hypothetical protein [Pseudomonas otitidis]
MKFQGAVILEQGVTFAIVLVKHSITGSQHQAEETRGGFQPYFPGIPVVLASQDSSGRFRFHGRKDLADFLANIHPSQIPWAEYTTS